LDANARKKKTVEPQGNKICTALALGGVGQGKKSGNIECSPMGVLWGGQKLIRRLWGSEK